MKKTKLFFDNILVYGLGGVIGKIIPIIMLPIVTRLMPDTSYFGINDLHSTIVSFASALALLGMYDSLYRLFFENEAKDARTLLCSTALEFVIGTALIAAFFIILFRNVIAEYVFHNRDYAFLCIIAAVTIVADNIKVIVQAPTRMQNKRKTFIITNFFTALIVYLLAIPLIIKGYYVIALPIAALISAVLMDIVFLILNHEWFNFTIFEKKYIPELLKIGVPLMPTFIIFWVFNSCDKLMISRFLGVAENGVYAVGSKLAHASQIINTAFGGGWTFFIYSTMKDKDRVESNSMIFELMSGVIYISSIGVFILAKPIYEIFFTGDYVLGYKVSPYLFCAPLMQMLFYVASDQLLIIKKSWPITVMLALGAIINILLNCILIPIMGIEGAAIATMMGYVVSLIVCICVIQKNRLLNISNKCYTLMALFYVFVIVHRISNENVGLELFIAILYVILFIIFYKNILIRLVTSIKSRNNIQPEDNM